MWKTSTPFFLMQAFETSTWRRHPFGSTGDLKLLMLFPQLLALRNRNCTVVIELERTDYPHQIQEMLQGQNVHTPRPIKVQSNIKNGVWVTEKTPGSEETGEPQRNRLLQVPPLRLHISVVLRFAYDSQTETAAIGRSSQSHGRHRNTDATETYKHLSWLADLLLQR